MGVRRTKGAPFYDSTEVDGDCLRWTGAHTKGGYGNYKDPLTKKNVVAHRWVYEQEVGPIPEGAQVDHVWKKGCRFRDCVKVEHLEPVTPGENVRRAAPARQTHCGRGHELDEGNTYIRNKGNGIRQCRRCHADDERARRAALQDHPNTWAG